MTRRSDTTPWGGGTVHVSPPWAFPSDHARRAWVATDIRHNGVMARHAWEAAIDWLIHHPEADAWVAEAKRMNRENRRQSNG